MKYRVYGIATMAQGQGHAEALIVFWLHFLSASLLHGNLKTCTYVQFIDMSTVLTALCMHFVSKPKPHFSPMAIFVVSAICLHPLVTFFSE